MARNRKRRNARPAPPQSNGSPAQSNGSPVNGDGVHADASTEEAQTRVPASVGAAANGHELANAGSEADRAAEDRARR